MKGKSSPELIAKTLKRQAKGRRFINFVLISGYLLLFAVVTFLVLSQSSKLGLNKSSSEVSRAASFSAGELPQDELSSLMIAQTVADMSGIGEVVPVSNQAATKWAELNQTALSDVNLSAKPQVVETTFTSYKGITTYKVKSGDTLSSIADKFGITDNSIRWSNNMSGYTVSKGQKLYIPPVNGIVYKVKSSDTAASLAKKYNNTSKDKIISFNDAEVNGLKVGSRIMLPGATKDVAPLYYYYQPSYGGNGYEAGQCTWYVANRVNVPNGWGNAASWDYYAGITPGWTVSTTPVAGAVAQDNKGYYGHVAVVESVSSDGKTISYSDMNHYWIPFQINHFSNQSSYTFDYYLIPPH